MVFLARRILFNDLSINYGYIFLARRILFNDLSINYGYIFLARANNSRKDELLLQYGMNISDIHLRSRHCH